MFTELDQRIKHKMYSFNVGMDNVKFFLEELRSNYFVGAPLKQPFDPSPAPTFKSPNLHVHLEKLVINKMIIVSNKDLME